MHCYVNICKYKVNKCGKYKATIFESSPSLSWNPLRSPFTTSGGDQIFLLSFHCFQNPTVVHCH